MNLIKVNFGKIKENKDNIKRKILKGQYLIGKLDCNIYWLHILQNGFATWPALNLRGKIYAEKEVWKQEKARVSQSYV